MVGTGVTLIVSNFETTVEKLVYGGDGLARLDGRVVLAPFVLPGERIRACAGRERPGLVHAQTLEILDPAPQRVPAPCPHFGRCGGCHYQHAPHEVQLAAKRAILAEELRRLGKIEPPAEIATVSADPWGYRNRVQLHVEGSQLGYREARSHSLRAIDACPIASPRINAVLGALAPMLHDPRWPRFIRSIEIFTDERQVQLNVLEAGRPVARRFFDWCVEQIPGLVDGALDYENRFRVSRGAFFQVNRFLADGLVETALGEARGETALDLYAGVGLFSLVNGAPIRPGDGRGIGIPCDPRSGFQRRTRRPDQSRNGAPNRRSLPDRARPRPRIRAPRSAPRRPWKRPWCAA